MTQVHHRNNSAWIRFGREQSAGTPTDSTPWLPFDMPTRTALATSNKRVFAHYFTTFPVSVDNDPAGATEYWQEKWLPPGTTEGTKNHAVYGGYVRDRKIFRAPRPQSNWKVLDKIDEVEQARSIGLDGFLVDVLQINGNEQWLRLLDLIEATNTANAAAGSSPPVKLCMMPDGTTSTTADADLLADNMAAIANEPCVYRHTDGRLLIAPYMPERVPAGDGNGGTAAVSFWTQFRNRMQNTYGINPHMFMCYTLSWTASGQAPAFNNIAFGHGRWGDRNPSNTGAANNSNRLAPQYNRTNFPGKQWMHFAAPQDVRPYGAKYWDAWGSENLRASWMAAIDGDADWVQVPTWDDFSESSGICPTRDSGWAWADLTSYYLVRFKLGYWPPIVRDAAYLFHRRQPLTGVTYSSGQTSFMARQGSDNHQDIEALVFLTDGATVEIRVNGSVIASQVYSSGGMKSLKVAQQNGTVSVRIIRNSTTVVNHTSPTPIATSQVSEDFTYKASSSLR